MQPLAPGDRQACKGGQVRVRYVLLMVFVATVYVVVLTVGIPGVIDAR